MQNKMTKKDYFKAIMALEQVSANKDFADFLQHEIDLLDKKATNKKPTKVQEENVAIKNEIVATLTDEGATVTDIMGKSETLKALSNQRVSALLRQLVDEGKAYKYAEGKKSLFKLA